MSNGEWPADPTEDSIEKFGRDLWRLRSASGQSIRDVEAAGGVKRNRVHEAEQGKRLPTVETTVAYVHGAGGTEGDVARWESRCRSLRQHLSMTVRASIGHDRPIGKIADLKKDGQHATTSSVEESPQLAHRRSPKWAAVAVTLLLLVSTIVAVAWGNSRSGIGSAAIGVATGDELTSDRAPSTTPPPTAAQVVQNVLAAPDPHRAYLQLSQTEMGLFDREMRASGRTYSIATSPNIDRDNVDSMRISNGERCWDRRVTTDVFAESGTLLYEYWVDGFWCAKIGGAIFEMSAEEGGGTVYADGWTFDGTAGNDPLGATMSDEKVVIHGDLQFSLLASVSGVLEQPVERACITGNPQGAEDPGPCE